MVQEKSESVETNDEKVEEAFVLEEEENETLESEAENACADKIEKDSGENVHEDSEALSQSNLKSCKHWFSERTILSQTL